MKILILILSFVISSEGFCNLNADVNRLVQQGKSKMANGKTQVLLCLGRHGIQHIAGALEEATHIIKTDIEKRDPSTTIVASQLTMSTHYRGRTFTGCVILTKSVKVQYPNDE